MKAGTVGPVGATAFVVALSIVMSGCGASSEDINTSSQGPTPSPPYKKGAYPIPVGPLNASAIANAKLTPEPVPSCGSWSDATISGSAASAIQEQYGEIRNCSFFDNYWVITTLGAKNSDGAQGSGVIAIYACNQDDSACLDGISDHALSGWSFVSPPHSGGLTILGYPVSGQIIGDSGGYQLLFDLASHTFPSSTQDTRTLGQ